MAQRVIPGFRLADLQAKAKNDFLQGKVGAIDRAVFSSDADFNKAVADAAATLSHANEAGASASAVAPDPNPVERFEALPTPAKVGIVAGIALLAYKLLGKK